MLNSSVKVLIQSSSSPAVYIATLTRQGSNLKAACTCQAGENNQSCKHLLALLGQDMAQVIKNETPNLEELVSKMLEGSNLALALKEVRDASDKAKAATESLKQAKKRFNKVMYQ